jgi:hypothetical protein
MRAFALFGVAFAACGLSTDIDPNGACVTDSNGFSTLDADSAGVPISLEISTKEATVDAFRVDHPATAGALTDSTASDGRYVLACKQVAGLKTVKMSVTRPAELTAFGAEWVQLFPKDSWANVTNEYEPFTFNEYGAKIPVFRPTTNGLTNDAANEGVLHVFMEVSDEGDFEVMYGNPSLTYDDKWVAVTFRSTLLRVGTPWAECSDAALGASTYDVGSIMPILFGGPNLNSVSLKAGNPSYLDVISELEGVTVPVKVVLEIFNTGKKTYTDSAVDGVCYKAGSACPEQHHVCKAEYCEMDVWKFLIGSFKAAGSSVSVLGSVDAGTSFSEYDTLGTAGVGWTGAGASGAPVDGVYFTDATATSVAPVDGGAGLVLDASRATASSFWNAPGAPQEGASGWTPNFAFDGNAATGWDGCCSSYPNQWIQYSFESAATVTSYEIMTQSGECPVAWQFQGSNDGTTWSTVDTVTGQSCHASSFVLYAVASPGPYVHYRWLFSQGVGGNSNGYRILEIKMYEPPPVTGVTVSAIGAPLFDESTVDDMDVYVTLASSDLGLWNPFSWYPYVPPSKWAAIVTEATDTSAVATLFDRGYGWVYLTSEDGLEKKSTITTDLLNEIEATATRRKLQARRLEASAPFWGCDDTLFECKPICMKTMGVATTKVSDTLCTSAPRDQCACMCFHEAQWTCEGESVVCKAKYGAGPLKQVGDKVCETRGAPKPASAAELRVASTCEPMKEMRGSVPTAECVAQWGKPEPTDAPAEQVPLIQESFASTLALAALALCA